MQDEKFRVKYISVNTCFVYLPDYWLRRLSSRQSAICVRHNDVEYYLSWCALPGPDPSALHIGATFARTLKIKEGDTLFVSSVDEAPTLASITVKPKSPQDRAILDLQSDNVQSSLLNQIRVVAKNQPIIAWTSKYNYVTLITHSLKPHFKYGCLENLTEIHVDDVPTVEAPKPISPSPLDGILHTIPASLKISSILSRRVYRVHPLPRTSVDLGTCHLFIAKDASEESFKSPFCVYVREKLLPFEIKKTGLWKVRKVEEDRQDAKAHMKFGKKMDTPRVFVATLRVIEDSLDGLRTSFSTIDSYFAVFKSHESINITHDLMSNLRMKTGGKVKLELIDEAEMNRVECTGIEIYPYEGFVTADVFKNFLTRNTRYTRMLLNSQATVTLEDGTRCLVKLIPEDCTYAFFDEDILKKIEIRVSDAASIEDNRPAEEMTDDVQVPLKNVAFDILETVIQKCKNTLLLSLSLHNVGSFEYDRENILISGVTGSGKTTVCKLLGNLFSEPPYFTHTQFVDCKSLKGKKAEVIHKLLMTEISHAVYYQPSILFLDDIESITSASSSTDENTPDAMNAARVTDVIFNIITEYQETNNISMVATCTDTTKVGKKLRDARGVHFFRTILSIRSLEKAERMTILRSSLEDKLELASDIDWEHYGNKTEGWVAQDLVVLADKAAFTAWKRHVKEQSNGSPILQDSDFQETLSRCTPMSLHGVDLYRGEGCTWSDIGGLADVKRALVEILYWPLKYPNIFKASPIKLQSGILLYGMPGTGKTMLAGAIAKECGLNLISVKGPELLSKYIGASEEAVRSVFEKAHRVKPCVVFFDEFDSLAPRRGHDSTGVTDRVVNQLLTHLDGIEGRDGVAVVAATSRPDLLDPALLRPGRLDKILLCPLPNENDREEILRSLCRKHDMNCNELDLKSIAGMTSGFTGADLNAIFMQARLDVIEEAMNSSSEGMKENYVTAKVTQNHLLNAMKSSKPSLLVMEKEKYKRIYKKFAKSDSSVVDELRHQKATLA